VYCDLSEERLKQLEERGSAMEEARRARRNLFMLRIVRLTIGILFISLLLVNIYAEEPRVKTVYSILLIALLAISVLQLYYLTRTRKRVPGMQGL